MTTTNEERTSNFIATEVTFEDDYFCIHLLDGRILSVPYEMVPSLSRATDEQRRSGLLQGMGTSLHWPDLDEDLSVEGLVMGRRIIDWQKDIKTS